MVVELYTSEGCSSCPPADRWLSALAGSGLADLTLPLSLHVDYWDYIGWPDRFAEARFTRRQREIAAENRLRTIYTPQVVLDGRDLPRWHRGQDFVAQLRERSQQAAPLALSINAQPRAAEVEISVHVRPVNEQPLPRSWTLVAGLTQDGLASSVERGENAGRRLTHDRVVRAWASDLRVTDSRAVVRLPLPSDRGGADVRAFAFAQSGAAMPLQAVDCALTTTLQGSTGRADAVRAASFSEDLPHQMTVSE